MEKNYNTKPKELILEFLASHKNKSFTAKEMYEEIQKKNGEINLATVYRNVARLEEAGKLLKHQDGKKNCATYQYIENEKCLTHFHFECRQCGKMVHLDAKETSAFLAMIQKKLFFLVEPQNTYMSGICNDCRKVFVSF